MLSAPLYRSDLSPLAGRAKVLRALLFAMGLASAGCPGGSGDESPIECSGKKYSEYINDVVNATIEYEKRCGLTDPTRETQRRAQLIADFPPHLTSARDDAFDRKRVCYQSTCEVEGFRKAPCGLGKIDAVRQACQGEQAIGRLKEGRECLLPEECNREQEGLYCRGIPQGALCGRGTCAKLGSLGSPCPEGNQACDPSSSHCVRAVCVPLENEGGVCNTNADCQRGLICLRPNVSDALGTCGKMSLGAMGAPCDLLDQAGKGCQQGLSCYKDAGGTYLCQPTVPLDGTCSSTEACEGTAVCLRKMPNDPTGTCRPRGKLNEDCSTDPRIGSVCQNTLQCYAFGVGIDDVCLKLPEIGEKCAMDLPCLSGVCNTRLPEPRCQAKAAAGLACSNNIDCVSNVCDAQSKKCVVPTCK